MRSFFNISALAIVLSLLCVARSLVASFGGKN